MQSLKDILDEKLKQPATPRYISREFQDFGYRLAEELGDLRHKALYIKLAKEEKRALLEEALAFTKAYYSARSKPKVFMWKLQQLKSKPKPPRSNSGESSQKSLAS